MSTATTNHSTDITAVYTSRQTLLDQMSTKHGYDVSEYTGFSYADIDAMISVPGQLDMLFDHTLTTVADIDNADGAATKQIRVPSETRTLVRYLMHPVMNRSQLDTICSDAFTVGALTGAPLTTKDALVIVAVGGSTGGIAVKQAIVFRWNTNHQYIVIHDVRCLKFNLLNHSLQPDNIHIATSKEYADIMSKYKLTVDQLPEISRFDPVAKVLGARPNDIVCFTRKSPTAVSTPYYRIVVD
jgi:DNA-directed RNA polymerase subunit H (RpoH/RPB5)